VNAIEPAYDYVIVGGGSAGSVVASRLAAALPAASVLLIEAGTHGRGVAQIVDPPQWTRLPGTALDWGYRYRPSAHVAGRAIPAPRGKVLGGCGATGAMRWFRGHPADYDAWEHAGATGWNYAALLPYFRRSEAWDYGTSEHRGRGGPLRVTRPAAPHPIASALVAGAAELGLASLDDPNAGHTEGAALANMNIADGRRFSVVDGYLPAWAPPPAPGQVPVGAWTAAPEPPANLTVLTGSTALRLGFGPGPRCEAVMHTVRGALHRTRARASVVLALGAFGTPELLIKSGIGDPAQLRALGLDPVACLPGVGRNLQDHPLLTGLHFLAKDRLGLARDAGGGALMNWRSSRARRPDLHAFAVQGPAACLGGTVPKGLAGDPRVFSICPALLGSVSRGRLTVRDPVKTGRDAVEIDAGFLAERSDLDALAEALDTVRDLAGTAAYAGLIDKPLLPPVGFSAAEKEAFVREHCSTSFHPCGTAAMGTGPDAVTDPELSVIGVAGLRIADASVIPVIPAGDIQAAVVAVAERAADLIAGGQAGNLCSTPRA
jgi:choline dehydrogenase